VLALLCGVGLVATLSRAAYIAFVPAVVVYGILRGRLARTAVLVTVVAGATVLFAPVIIERLAETGMEDGSTRGHLMAATAGLGMVRDNPILGVGAGNFAEHYLGYTNDPRSLAKTGHNTWLMIAAELGLPALLMFAGLHLAGLWRLLRASRLAHASGDDAARVMIGAFGAMLVAFMLIGVFHSLHIAKYGWILLALALGPATQWLASDENAEGAEEADTVSA